MTNLEGQIKKTALKNDSKVAQMPGTNTYAVDLPANEEHKDMLYLRNAECLIFSGETVHFDERTAESFATRFHFLNFEALRVVSGVSIDESFCLIEHCPNLRSVDTVYGNYSDDRVMDLIEVLEDPNYRARVQRAFVFEVAAFDWNCPQHITERYTLEDLGSSIQPLHNRIAELERQLAESRTKT